MKDDLALWLADPENLDKFIGIAITESLGYELTEDGEWVRI